MQEDGIYYSLMGDMGSRWPERVAYKWGGIGKGLGVLSVRQALLTITPHRFATPFAHSLPSSRVPLRYSTPYLAT